MKTFAVAGTFIKDKDNGTQNIITYINIYNSVSPEEATGKIIHYMIEKHPNHHIFGRPVQLEIIPPKSESGDSENVNQQTQPAICPAFEHGKGCVIEKACINCWDKPCELKRDKHTGGA